MLKQIVPFRISSVDVRFLLCAAPRFELFFARYRGPRIGIRFEVNELVCVVLPSERASESERMFAGTPFEIVRDTNVQDCVTIRVRQNVNEVILVSHQSSWVTSRDSSTSLGMTSKNSF